VIKENSVEEISSTPFLPYEKTGIVHSLDQVRLLAPCLPSKIVAVGLNYKEHAAEMKMPLPSVPMFFFKPSTAVVGTGRQIVWPPDCEQLDFEGELAVVIGSVAKSVRKDRWAEVVAGYTCGIDATARDQQKRDDQWGRCKGFDTSAPLGPWLETDLDPGSVALTTRVNGEIRQSASTSDLVFDIGSLLEFITSSVTLLPGDVVMTGTPAGSGPLAAGDQVTVEIENIGSLDVSVKGRPTE